MRRCAPAPVRAVLAFALTFAFAFAASACGPSTTSLLAKRQYREALCAGDEEEVGAAIFADSGAHVHMHVVTPEELLRVVSEPKVAEDIGARARIVRLTLETNRMPIDGMRVSLTSAPAVVSPPSWQRLAQLTGEPLPPQEQRTTSLTAGNLFNLGAIVFTGGLWLLTKPTFNKGTYLVDAPPAKYLAMAPRAFALREATASEGCLPATSVKSESPVGLACATYLVVDRVGARPVDLVFTFEYASYRWTPEERDPEPRDVDVCLGKHVVRVPLEDTPGVRPRRLTELARR